MAKFVKGISKLNKMVQNLKTFALEVSDNHSAEVKIYHDSSEPDHPEHSEPDTDYLRHLMAVNSLLAEIELLTPVILEEL